METIFFAAAASAVTVYSAASRYADRFRQILIATATAFGCAAFLGVYYLNVAAPAGANGGQWLSYGIAAAICGPLAGLLIAKYVRRKTD